MRAAAGRYTARGFVRSLAGLLVLVFAAPGCAPLARHGRSIDDPPPDPHAVLSVGRDGDVVYAWTRSRKLRAWDLKTRAWQMLDRGGVIGLARDGAVALSESDGLIEAWEPSSGRLIARHRFQYGIGGVLGVSRATAIVVAKLLSIPYPGAALQVLPRTEELVAWDLASGKVEPMSVSGCEEPSLSADGTTAICGLFWIDLRSRAFALAPDLAPEWAPPDPDADRDDRANGCTMCAPHEPPTGLSVLSSWLSPDGRTVYTTYMRTEGGTEWRLDRWTPDPSGKTHGRIERIATSGEPIADRVVVVSQDGRTVVTAPGRRPPVLRHAPGYEGIPLLAPPVTAAVFSQDEQLVVTGHGDGRLRLWDARSGRLEDVTP